MQNKYISEEAYYNSMNKNPVYVVLMNGGTPLSKIISGFTGDTYTHACISFNAKLKPLYSFGLTNDSTFGFAVANPRDKKAFPHIDKYAVYVMYVSNHQLYKMKKRLKWFIDNGKDLKFDFPALVSVFFQKDTENHSDKYFCSRFVAEILKMGEVDLEKKASLYRPESLLALSNISLVNWGRDIIGYNWIKTRDNERLIKQNRYVHPTSLIPKFESVLDDNSTKQESCITEAKIPKSVRHNKLFFLSDKNMNNKTLTPRTPNNYFTKNGYEDAKTKRVCFAPSIDKALMGLSANLTNKEFYVHVPIGEYKTYKPTKKEVPDSNITGEIWITNSVKVICIGKIVVIKDKGLKGHKFKYGDKEAELYDWKWEWVDKLNDIPESYMEEDSKYDFYNRAYGKEYTKNLHRVEILKTRLKQGKITQEEFDKEYEKIKPASSFKIKPDKNGVQKVDYNRPNKNKSDNSAKKIYKGNPDSPRVDGDLSKVDGEKFDHYASILMRTENYNDYKTAFRNMARLLGKPNASAIRISDYSWKGNVECRCYNSKKSANCGSDIKLYHTSETRGLTRLNGRFRSKDGVYYSSKRVYFHKGKPGSRMGGDAKENDYIYEFIGNPSQAYVDPELGSTAVFIETDTSVPVKDVTDQFRNKDSKEIKESCYKLEETMLYEFANKELLDKIHVTSDVELSKWMKSNIKYQEFKTLMTPEEVFESRMGSCHDQVVFELAVLKALKYSPKALFFIEYNDGDNVGGQTHSFVYYRRGTKFYWFENAWGGQAGIHGPYKNVKELKNDIISKHDTKKYKKLQFASFKGKEGMTLAELVKACLK